MNIIIRLVIKIILIYQVYLEVGPATTLSIFLIFFVPELVRLARYFNLKKWRLIKNG